jgi:hypothetical protein
MAVTGFNNEEGKMAQQLVGTKYLPFDLELVLSYLYPDCYAKSS